MRISVVVPSFYPAIVYGGSIFASLNIAHSLADCGHEVYVSTTDTNMYSRLEVMPNKFINLESGIFVKYYKETILNKLSIPLLLSVWKDIKAADCIHIHAIFNTPIPAALGYARLFNKPVLLSPHGVLGDWVMRHGLGFKKLWLSFFIKPFANYVYWHATSIQEKKEILNHFPDAKIFVIPNIVSFPDPAKIKKIARREFLYNLFGHVLEPEKVVVSMGRLQKKKGFDILIESFEAVCNVHTNSILIIAGPDEGERENLIKLAKEYGLSQKVFFVGNLKGGEKWEFFSQADVFVLPSHNENFGIVYAEALSMGCPIVASKNTPWEEVEQLQCGKWVNNTEKDIANATLEILNNGKDYYSQNAINYSKTFASKVVAPQFDNVFNSIMNRNS